MIYCMLCNPALDVVYELDEFKVGATLTDVQAHGHPAGKGINVAGVVRTLGEDVSVIGVVADGDRERFTRYLDRTGIRHTLLSVEGCVRINTTLVEKNTGQVTHINGAGPMLSTRIQDNLQALVEKKMGKGDVWAATGSLPPGFDSDAYAKIIHLCRKKGAEVLLDTRGIALKVGLRACPHMVKPNLTELEDFFGEQIHGVRHIALKGKRLLDAGVRHVFVSLGVDGMIAIHGKECLLCSPPRVDAVDTVGCGDALVGGVLVAGARGFSFTETCRLAVACGTSNALRTGPGNVDPDEVWRFMEKVEIQAI